MNNILTPEKVHALFEYCFSSEDNKGGLVINEVHGISNDVCFDQGCIDEKFSEILEMLNQISSRFHTRTGFSFLMAYTDSTGKRWVDNTQHSAIEELFQLGIAAGIAHYSTPRGYWALFPGGMPYVVIDTSEQ